MKFDRDGLPFVGLAAAPSVVAALWRRPRWALSLLALPAAVGLFFRDPDRQPDRDLVIDPDVVLAPADGRIMHVGEPQPDVAPAGEWLQIVTFLSVTDVHINRSPYAGEVTEISYRPGRFLAAFTPESGAENERSEIWLRREVDDGERVVVFRQIVGLMARRVVTRLSVGETVSTGQRMGLMKFGSRMDVFVPTDVEIMVSVGDRMVAGETILARWPIGGASA